MSIEKLIIKYSINKKQTDYNIKKELINKMRKLINIYGRMKEDYAHIQSDFIGMFEGCRLQAYDEQTGKTVNIKHHNQDHVISVGYGFNMNRKEAIEEWKEVLPVSLFNQIYHGKAKLTECQANKLLEYALKQRQGELNVHFSGKWHLLPINIKIALESVYYNSPGLFSNALKTEISNYLDYQDEIYLLRIASILMKYKHKNFDFALHQRRQLECLLLCGIDDLSLVIEKLEKLDYQNYLSKLIA